MADGFRTLGDKLAPHARAMKTILQAAEEAAARAPVRMTEAQLMRLAFDRLGEDIGSIDWDRIQVVPEPQAPAAASPRPSQRAAPAPPVPTAAPSPQLPPRPDWIGGSWRDELPPDPEHRRLEADQLRRVARRQGSVPSLNLHGLDRHGAVHQLDQFVRLSRAQGFTVVRVITGKGLGSKGAPVVRPRVLAWLCEPGRPVAGWSPETDDDGDFGSLLTLLQARRPRP